MGSKIIDIANRLNENKDPGFHKVKKKKIFKEKTIGRLRAYQTKSFPLGKSDPRSFSVITSGPFEGDTVNQIPDGKLIIPFRYDGEFKIHKAIHVRHYNERRGVFFYRLERIQ